MSLPRYPEYKDSRVAWLAEVPEHWEVTALKRGFQVVGGSTPKSDNEAYWDGEIIWVTPSDLSKLSSFEVSNSQRKITADGLSSCGTALVPIGSIILSTRAPIGSLAIADSELCTNQGCKALVPNYNNNSRFYAYFLSVATGELNIRGKGTTFLELSGDELGSFKATFPTALEQTAIAAFLDCETGKIDMLVTEQEKLIALLMEKRQAVISHAVTKSLNAAATMKDSGIEWLGEVPKHWEVKRLKRVCLVFPSNVDKKSQDGETSVSLCNYTDVYYNDTITDDMAFMSATATDEQIAKFTLRAGDTIITKDSETADDIAIGAYVPADLPGVVCGYHLSMLRPMTGTDGAFVKRLFDSTYVKSSVAIRANGLTRVGLGQYEIDNLELPFPSLEEQEAITDFLAHETAKLDALTAEAQRGIELLKERRSALISAAVTGKIDVRGVDELKR